MRNKDVYRTYALSAGMGESAAALIAPEIERTKQALLYGVNKSLQPKDLSFSLVNFLLEFKDVLDLAKPVQTVYKRLKRTAPRRGPMSPKVKLKRSEFRRHMNAGCAFHTRQLVWV